MHRLILMQFFSYVATLFLSSFILFLFYFTVNFLTTALSHTTALLHDSAIFKKIYENK